MKKLLLIALALGGFSSAFAQKRVVKFSVDMTGVTISSNGVHVAGNFQSWKPGDTKLTQEGSTNIYSVYAECDENSVVEYKFINDNNWGSGEETIPAICRKGHSNNGQSNGNRWFFAGSGTDTLKLPAIKFGGSAPDGQSAVRIAVDMAKVSSVSADGVYVAGSLYTWDEGKWLRMTNLFSDKNMVYEALITLSAGDYAYKFVNGKTWSGGESIPDACKVGNDRGFKVVSGSDLVIDKVCFSSCDLCPSRKLPTYKVTFQVDMSTACNWDSVDMAGGLINGWGGGTFLTDKGGKIYTVTLEFDSATEVEYKYRKIKTGSDPSWEGTSNRKATILSDTVLAVHCFDSKAACTATPTPSDITFLVDMTNEIVASAGVHVMGTFQDPNWQAGAIKMDVHPNNSNWYTTTVTAVCPGSFAYKFTNGDPNVKENEELFEDTLHRGCVSPNGLGGFNRTYTRVDEKAATIVYYFDSCSAPAPSAGVNKNFIANSEIRVMPNPSEGTFTVSLAGTRVSVIEVRSISGQVVRTLYSNENSVNVDLTGMNGIYLVNIQDSMGRTSTQKVVLK